jgi:CHAD domain-containing protein
MAERPVRPSRSRPDASRVVAAAVRTTWQATREEIARFRRDAAEAGAHDLRVALRRLLAALELAEVLDAAAPPKLVRRLQRLLRALSPLRDAEVQAKAVARLGEGAEELAALVPKLERRRSVLARTIAERLRRFSPDRTELALERCVAALEADSVPPGVATALLLGALAHRYLRFERRRRAVTAPERRAVHRVRLAFKQYRYTAEVAHPLLSTAARRRLLDMKGFQDELGAVQDASVLVAMLEATWCGRGRAPSGPVQELIRSLKRERGERIAAVLATLGAQLAARPPAFSELLG